MIGFIYTQNTKGVLHSHYEDVIINNGTQTLTTIPTYSPNDIGTFLNMINYVKTNSQNDISEMYTALTSPNGNFIIKFTGDDNDLAHNNSSALLDIRKEANLGNLDKIYTRDYIDKANTYEAGLLNFIKNKMKVQGLSLYKVDKNGEVSEIKLKETNPKSDVKIKC